MKTPFCSLTKIIGCITNNRNYKFKFNIILKKTTWSNSSHLQFAPPLYLALLSNITETSYLSVWSNAGKWETYEIIQISITSQHRDDKGMVTYCLDAFKVSTFFLKVNWLPIECPEEGDIHGAVMEGFATEDDALSHR